MVSSDHPTYQPSKNRDDYKPCNPYIFISSSKITRHDKITEISINPTQYIENKSCTTQYITKLNIILKSLKIPDIKIKVIQYHIPKIQSFSKSHIKLKLEFLLFLLLLFVKGRELKCLPHQ